MTMAEKRLGVDLRELLGIETKAAEVDLDFELSDETRAEIEALNANTRYAMAMSHTFWVD